MKGIYEPPIIVASQKLNIQYPLLDLNKNNLGTIEEIKEFHDELYLGTFMGSYKMTTAHPEMLVSDHFLPTFKQISGSSIENFVLGEINNFLLFGGQGGLKILYRSISRVIHRHDPRKLIRSNLYPNVIFEGHTEGVCILIFDKDKIIKEITIDVPSHEFRGVAETNEWDLWLTTMINDVFFVKMAPDLKPVSINRFTTEDGLPSLRDNLVYKVDGQIYFTTHKGIYSFDSLAKRFIHNNTFGKIYTDDSRYIYSFCSDEKSNVWLNAFNKRETGHAVKQANGSYTLDHTSFNVMNQMQMYDILAQADGVTWFGGSDGLVRLQKPIYEKPESAFNAKIRKVTIGVDSTIYWG